MQTVLFICSGNICRSPMAEGLLRKMLNDAGITDIEVHSAGTLGIEGAPASSAGMAACWDEFGVDISRHRSKGVTPAMLQEADWVLCMAREHLRIVQAMWPEGDNHCFLLNQYAGIKTDNWDVFDPIGSSYAVYRNTCLELAALIAAVVPKLRG